MYLTGVLLTRGDNGTPGPHVASECGCKLGAAVAGLQLLQDARREDIITNKIEPSVVAKTRTCGCSNLAASLVWRLVILEFKKTTFAKKPLSPISTISK